MSLDDALDKALRENFPEVAFDNEMRFRPMFSLHRGLLSSSVLLRVAQTEKVSTEEVAQRLISCIELQLPVQLASARGYLVCRELPLGLLRHHMTRSLDEVQLSLDSLTPTHESVMQYCCIVPDRRSPAYARLRLVSRILILTYLSVSYGRPVRVLLYPFVSKVVRSKKDCLELFSGAADMILREGGDASLEDTGYSDQDMFGTSTKFILTSHACYELMPKQIRDHLNRARKSGIMVAMPSDGWLLSRDRSLSNLLGPDSLRKHVQEIAEAGRWDMFLFHCAGTVASGDFDPAVALFDECASPLWNLRLLIERFEKIFKGSHMPADTGLNLPDHYRMTTQGTDGLRGFFMNHYIALTLQFGMIEDFMEVVEAFVNSGQRFINMPRIRSTERFMEDWTEEERYFFTGLGRGLSTILPLATEDACAGQQ